jgi:alkylation response protein AidB-like acyl-CoA dehydrogenase
VQVAAMISATVESALQLAIGHAGKRHSFGKPLIGHQGLRWQLASVATELEAARLLVDRAADLIEAGADAQIEAAFAKKYAAEMALRGIAACMQVMGAEGLRASHPLGRHMVAARIAAYVDGTTEIQNERIGVALAARYGVAP